MIVDDPVPPLPVCGETGVVPLRGAENVQSKSLTTVSFIDVEPNLDVADFVEGFLIEGQLSIVYGESNAGKTFWVTDLCFHIAAGMVWNGRDVVQGPVLYLALEGSYGIQNRVAAFKQENGLEDLEIQFYIAAGGLDLLHPHGDVEAVVRTVKELEARTGVKFSMIVVDTIMRAMFGGNENSSEDMGALVRNLDIIRHETGAHVMGIHHSGKDQAKGARGWSGLRGAIDTEIEIKADSNSKTARVVKQRDLPKGDVFTFALKVITLGQNKRGKDVTSCVVEPSDCQAAGGAFDRKKSLKGHTKRAFDILGSLVAQSGLPDHGAPPGDMSVSEKLWRELFYDAAVAGTEQKAKEKAFRRAVDNLARWGLIGMLRDRVWII